MYIQIIVCVSCPATDAAPLPPLCHAGGTETAQERVSQPVCYLSLSRMRDLQTADRRVLPSWSNIGDPFSQVGKLATLTEGALGMCHKAAVCVTKYFENSGIM